MKSPYCSQLTYQSSTGDTYKGSTIVADVKLETTDGEKYYFKRRNNNLYLVNALVQSEMTLSGFMWMKLDGNYPIVFKETTGSYASNASITIDRGELSPKYSWLAAKGEKFTLEITYNYNINEVQKGFVEINNAREKAIQYTTSVQVAGKFFIHSNKIREEYPLNPFLWPGSFKQDMAWGNYKIVKLYTDSYTDALVVYKTNGREVTDIKLQAKKDTKIFQLGEKAVIAYPNPTFGEVYFDLINYPKGKYKLEIYNVVGGKIFSYNFTEIGNSQLKADISNLNRGIYQFVILDAYDRRLSTQRINLISP